MFIVSNYESIHVSQEALNELQFMRVQAVTAVQ